MGSVSTAFQLPLDLLPLALKSITSGRNTSGLEKIARIEMSFEIAVVRAPNFSIVFFLSRNRSVLFDFSGI